MSSKILVVDDEQDLKDLVVQRFRRNIRKGEYEFKSRVQSYRPWGGTD